MNASAPPSPKAALSLSKRSQAVSAVTAPMGDPNLHTQPDPAARLQVVPDQLTGLETVPLDAVTPVRVEVLAREGDPMRNPASEPSPTLEALLRELDLAQSQLAEVDVLQRQLQQLLERNL